MERNPDAELPERCSAFFFFYENSFIDNLFQSIPFFTRCHPESSKNLCSSNTSTLKAADQSQMKLAR
jgi:hypothetical protein